MREVSPETEFYFANVFYKEEFFSSLSSVFFFWRRRRRRKADDELWWTVLSGLFFLFSSKWGHGGLFAEMDLRKGDVIFLSPSSRCYLLVDVDLSASTSMSSWGDLYLSCFYLLTGDFFFFFSSSSWIGFVVLLRGDFSFSSWIGFVVLLTEDFFSFSWIGFVVLLTGDFPPLLPLPE